MTALNDVPFVEYLRGDDFSQAFQILKNGDPVDLTGAGTDVAICFPKEDGSGSFTYSLLASGITLLSGALGKFVLTWVPADGRLMTKEQRFNLDFVVTIGGKQKTYRFDRAMTIDDRQC